MCYHNSDPGLIPREGHINRSRATQFSILPRSVNEYRIIPGLTPGQPRWGRLTLTITYHWWFDWRQSTYDPRLVTHTQVDLSAEPYSSRWTDDCLSVLDHFSGLALKELSLRILELFTREVCKFVNFFAYLKK